MNRSKLLIATLLGSSLALFVGPKTVIAQANTTYEICDAALKLSSVPQKGLKDWLFIDSEFASNRFAWEFEWGKQYDPVRRFSETLERQGMKLIVIPVPNRPAIYTEGIDTSKGVQGRFKIDATRANYDDSVTQFRKAGISTVNLQEAFLARVTDPEHLFFARDHHWTPAGARVAAQAVKAQMQTSGLFAQLPKVDYATRMIGTYDFHGNIPDVLEKTCPGVRVPNEQTPNYVTERQGAGNLLGDEQIDVTLIGSSYSAPPWSPKELDYNFAGFLQDQLQTSVVNAAISGGGYDASLEAYFLSKAYAEHKPKFILFEFWYFPYAQQLNAFRRIIPSMYGACDESRTVIADKTVSFEATTPSLLVSPMLTVNAQAGIKGTSNYLYFELSDLNLTNFKVSLEYDNGQTEIVPVNRNERIKNDGRFFLDLNDAYSGNLLKASLLTETKTTGQVKTRLCRAPAPVR
jgi:alginate biosynthesis protein AlgX